MGGKRFSVRKPFQLGYLTHFLASIYLFIGDSDYYFYRFIEKERRTKPDGVSRPWVLDSNSVGIPGPSTGAPATSSVELMDLATAFQKGVIVETHVYRFKQYKKTFIGSEGEPFAVFLDRVYEYKRLLILLASLHNQLLTTWLTLTLHGTEKKL